MSEQSDVKLRDAEMASVHRSERREDRFALPFDIEVSVTPLIGNTTANLWGALPYQFSDGSGPGCDTANCDCVSRTTATPVTTSYIFQLPLPSTICSQ